jgi:hypothetical protein
MFSQNRNQPIWTDLRGCFHDTDIKKGNVETFPALSNIYETPLFG